MSIQITQGDDVTLRLQATNGEGTALDLTGATLTTYLAKTDGTQLEISNGSHTLENQATNTGWFTVSISAALTATLQRGTNQDIITKIVQSGLAMHVHGEEVLTVLSNSTVRPLPTSKRTYPTP